MRSRLLLTLFLWLLLPAFLQAAEASMVVSMSIGGEYKGVVHGLFNIGLPEISLSTAHPEDVAFALTIGKRTIDLRVVREGSGYTVKPVTTLPLSTGGPIIFSVF